VRYALISHTTPALLAGGLFRTFNSELENSGKVASRSAPILFLLLLTISPNLHRAITAQRMPKSTTRAGVWSSSRMRVQTSKNPKPFRGSFLTYRKIWRPRRDLNPCYRRERPVSWAELDDGDVLVSRAGFEPATLCLKGRCSTA
jgi:hypothetical protein